MSRFQLCYLSGQIPLPVSLSPDLLVSPSSPRPLGTVGRLRPADDRGQRFAGEEDAVGALLGHYRGVFAGDGSAAAAEKPDLSAAPRIQRLPDGREIGLFGGGGGTI